MKIVLIGYMGSGKSVVGKHLASCLGFNFKDLDIEIETSELKTIPQLILKKGEIYFRKTERKIVLAALETKNNTVLATGGGTPCYGDNMDIFVRDPNIIIVYLKSSINDLTDRIYSERSNRPLISHIESKDELKDFISKHLFERSYYYNRASMIINTEGKSVHEIVEEIRVKL